MLNSRYTLSFSDGDERVHRKFGAVGRHPRHVLHSVSGNGVFRSLSNGNLRFHMFHLIPYYPQQDLSLIFRPQNCI